MASTEKKEEPKVMVADIPAGTYAKGAEITVENLREADYAEDLGLRVADLHRRISDMETQFLNLTCPPPSAADPVESITATMVGGTFNCPECGLRITSPALIKTQGLKAGGYYEHPFDESPRLNGGKCRLIGKKFESPSIVLKMIQPKPAPKVDVAETIGV